MLRLLEGVCAGIVAELNNKVSQAKFTNARLATYARRLVHVDPGTINVQASVWVVEEFELVVPEAVVA